MSQERTEAIVLRGVDYGDSSRIITFLTPDRGRVACMAKGARQSKSPFAAALNVMNRLEMVYYWKQSRSVQQLGEIALLNSYGGIHKNLEKMVLGAVPIEMAGKIAHENEPSELLYAVFREGLESLDRWPGDIRAHVCWQMVQLLAMAGFEPTLDTCAGCGSSVTLPAGFIFEGGVVCSQCRYDHRLTAEQYEQLCAVVRSASCPDLADMGIVYGIMRRFAERQLETDLRSARVAEDTLG